MWQWEFELGVDELLDVWSSNLSGGQLRNLDDMNGAETGTVATSHILIHGINSFATAHFTELLVHVVGTGATVVTEPNTKVLDFKALLLENFSD